jgi:hypothetical protein
MPVMDRVHHAPILPFPRSPLGAGQAQCGRNIQKNRCRTTVPSRFGETLAKRAFTGNQVICLGRDQAGSSGPGGSIRQRTSPVTPSTDLRSFSRRCGGPYSPLSVDKAIGHLFDGSSPVKSCRSKPGRVGVPAATSRVVNLSRGCTIRRWGTLRSRLSAVRWHHG